MTGPVNNLQGEGAMGVYGVAVAQRNEILSMCIAYNLTRLIFLGVDRGIEIDFSGGAQVLSRVEWVPLAVLHDQFRGVKGQMRPEWTT